MTRRSVAVRPPSPIRTLIAAALTALAVLVFTACGDGAAPPPTLELAPTIANVMVGGHVHYAARMVASDKTATLVPTGDVTWATSDATIATIGAAGDGADAIGKKGGTVTITARYNDVTAQATLKVDDAGLTSIEVTPTAPSIAKGTKQQLTATGVYSDGHKADVTATATWTSADATIIAVDDSGAKGTITGAKVGTTTVTATIGAVKGETNATTTNAALVSLAVTPTMPTVAKGLTKALTATGTFSDDTTQVLTTQVAWESADTSIATVKAGVVTTLKAGGAKISASFNGVVGSTMLTVSPAELASLAITPPTPSVPVGLTETLVATGTYTDDTTAPLNAVWTSSDTNVATIDNLGVVTAVATGTTTITATYGAFHNTATLTVSEATLVSIAIDPSPAVVAKGFTKDLTATGTFSDKTKKPLTTQVTWKASNEAIAKISNAAGSEGHVTTLDAGEITISATLGTVTGTSQLVVSPAVLVSIGITPSAPSLAKGLTGDLTATGTYSDQTTQPLTTQVTWKSSDETIATIDNAPGSKGKVTALVPGETTITATTAGVTGSTKLTVTAATLKSIAITPTNPSIVKGLTKDLTATGTYTDDSTQPLTDKVTWKSSDEKVATVSNADGSRGVVSTPGAGTATITATLDDVVGSTSVTVTPATLKSIAITPTNPSVAKGTTRELIATGTYSDDTTQPLTTKVTWKSSDEAIATVSNAAGTEGVASGVAEGTATITASLDGVDGTTKLTVNDVTLTGIEIAPLAPSVAKGVERQFTATGTFSDMTTQELTSQVTWASADETVATISNDHASAGLATTLKAGTTKISASLHGVTADTTLTVTPAKLVSIDITPPAPSIAKGLEQPLTATGTYSDHTTQPITAQVTWKSSDEKVATVSNAQDSEGLATSVDVGSTKISATLDGVTAEISLTVTPATLTAIEVAPATASIAKGLTQDFTATGTYSDHTTQPITTQVTWASSDDGIATVSNAAGSEGLATSVAVGTATITAKLDGVTGKATLEITPAILKEVQIDQATPSVAKGATRALTATAIFSDNSKQPVTAQATWTSSAEDIATISNTDPNQGVATGKAIGTTTITAAFGGKQADVKLAVTDAELVSIEVTPAAPTIAAGDDQPFVATGTYTDSTSLPLTDKVTWESSDHAIATISNADGSRGVAHGLKAGDVTITATLGTIVGKAALKVSPATLKSIAVTPATVTIHTGEFQAFVATGTYSDATTKVITKDVTWTSGDESLATISNTDPNQGVATAVAVGDVTVTATLGDVKADAKLTITPPPTLMSIAVTPDTKSIPKGELQQLVATGTYSDNSTKVLTAQVTWTSSDSNVVSVVNAGATAGLATGKVVGDATITAALGAITGTATITVADCKVVVNEVSTAGTGGAADEYVELYNTCSFPVDLIGHKLVYRSATGTGDTTLSSITVATPIDGKGWLLFANKDYAGTGAAAADIKFSAGLSGTAGGVGLRNAAGDLIDSMGYGSTATNAFIEGGAAADAPDSAKAVSRVPDGHDTNNNKADFKKTDRTPRAANPAS